VKLTVVVTPPVSVVSFVTVWDNNWHEECCCINYRFGEHGHGLPRQLESAAGPMKE